MGRKTYSALVLMSSIPDFKRSLAKLLPNLIGRESKAACKKLKDADVKLSRDILDNFSVDQKYEELTEECPLLMSVLFSASCSKKSRNIKVISLTVKKGILTIYIFLNPRSHRSQHLAATEKGVIEVLKIL